MAGQDPPPPSTRALRAVLPSPLPPLLPPLLLPLASGFPGGAPEEPELELHPAHAARIITTQPCPSKPIREESIMLLQIVDLAIARKNTAAPCHAPARRGTAFRASGQRSALARCSPFVALSEERHFLSLADKHFHSSTPSSPLALFRLTLRVTAPRSRQHLT